MLRSSDLIAQALKLKPEPGLPVWTRETTHCSHCAAPIVEGDPYSPVSLGEFFSDTRDLADDNGLVCWRCVHVRSKVLLNGLSFTVVTQDEIYPIAQNIHKAWLFLDPPEPPFVAMNSSSTMQHLAWRTPVTLDKRRITIRFGPKLFHVKPDNIRQALAYCAAINARVLEKKPKEKWVSPLFLDRKVADASHGKLNPKLIEFMTEEEIRFYRNLSAGDRWALTAVMNSKLPQPEKPEPITKEIAKKL